MTKFINNLNLNEIQNGVSVSPLEELCKNEVMLSEAELNRSLDLLGRRKIEGEIQNIVAAEIQNIVADRKIQNCIRHAERTLEKGKNILADLDERLKESTRKVSEKIAEETLEIFVVSRVDVDGCTLSGYLLADKGLVSVDSFNETVRAVRHIGSLYLKLNKTSKEERANSSVSFIIGCHRDTMLYRDLRKTGLKFCETDAASGRELRDLMSEQI